MRWILALNEPDANASDVARRACVSTSLLYRWRQQLAAAGDGPAFIPIAVRAAAAERPSADPSRGTMTIAFGQGISVAPLQAMMAVAALVNGGHMMTPTFLMRDEAAALAASHRVVSEQTSESMRYLMRSNATHGSASFANVEGYYVGGKTGTADKIFHGHYSNDKVFTTFMAISPANKPKYLYLVLYDQPQAAPGDGGYHTAAYNSGRVAGALLRRVEPLVGHAPLAAFPQNPFPIIAKLGFGGDADKIGKE